MAAAILIFSAFKLLLDDIYFRGSSFVQAIIGVTLAVTVASMLTAFSQKSRTRTIRNKCVSCTLLGRALACVRTEVFRTV